MNERVIQMMTKDGFIALFDQEMKDDKTSTQIQIFEKLNLEYKEIFGFNRYSSYNSFDFVRRRDLKKHGV